MAGSRGVLRGQAGRRSCCSSPAPPFSLFLGRIMGIRLTAGRRRPARSATLAGYLAELHEQGRAPSSASTAVAAARFRARLAVEPSPAGETNGPGSRRLPADRRRSRAGAGAVARGRGPGRRPSPPASGRGRPSPTPSPLSASRLDAVITGILFMTGMRRSEVSALRWADIDDAANGDGILAGLPADRRVPPAFPPARRSLWVG